MADNLKIVGLRFKIDGAAEFNQSIAEINSKLGVASAEFSKLTAQYGSNSKNIEVLTGKQKLLQERLQGAKDIGQQYNRILEDTVAKYGENSVEADKVRAAIAKNEAEQIRLEKALTAVSQQIAVQSSAWTQLGDKCKAAGDKLKDIGDKVSGIGQKIMAAGAVITGALGGIAVSAAKASDDINTLSKQTGISTEQLQKFSYAADLIDVDVDTMAKAYAKLTRSMQSAVNGSKNQAAAFEALGVSVTDSTGQLRDNEIVFGEIIAALGKVENETQRDAYAMQIFGKSAQELNPLILGGAEDLARLGDEAENLGLVMGQQTLDSLNRFNDVLDSSRAKFTAVKNILGAKLVDALSPYLDKIAGNVDKLVTKLANLNPKTIATVAAFGAVTTAAGAVLVVGGKLASLVGSAISGFGSLALAVGKAGSIMGGLSTAFGGLAGPVALVVTALAALVPLLADNDSAFGNLNRTLRDSQNAWDGLQKSRETALENGTQEINNIQSLKAELDGLVDANGKVKSGYEDRAAFIASELSSATGQEIALVDGAIQSYNELSAAIDAYILKRKAEIVLESESDAYEAAIKGRKELEQAYVDSYNAMLKAQDNYNSASAGRDQANARAMLDNATATYEGIRAQYEGYGEAIKAYETDLAAFRSGKYAEVAAGLGSLLMSMEEFTVLSAEQMQQQVADTEAALNEKLTLYQLNGDETTRLQAEALAQQLADEQSYLSERNTGRATSDAELLSAETTHQAAMLSLVTDYNSRGEAAHRSSRSTILADENSHQASMTSEAQRGAANREGNQRTNSAAMESEARRNMTEMVNSIKSQQTAMSAAMQLCLDGVKLKVSSIMGQARSWGQNLIQGFVNGIRDKIQAVRDAASSVTAAAGDYLGFHSPAKKGEGRFIVDWGFNMIRGFVDGMTKAQSLMREAASAMASVAVRGVAAASSSNIDNRQYSYGGITVSQLVVREEADITRIARELYRLQRTNARGRAVTV